MDLTNPGAFRALAHPLRLELFERLAIMGTATASQLAAHVGQSPANCSFHLRQLAKHGYIERDDSADGRERPWRVIDVSQNWESSLPDDLVAPREALEDALRTWDDMRLRQARRSPAPEGFAGTMLSSRSTLWLTPAETAELTQKIAELMVPFVNRWQLDKRPTEGRPIRVITEMYAVPDRPDADLDSVATTDPAPTDATTTETAPR